MSLVNDKNLIFLFFIICLHLDIYYTYIVNLV